MAKEIIPVEQVARRILYFRDEKVLLDFDLAVLYGLAILEAIRQLMASPERPRREIGFHVREKAPPYRVRKRA
jgi:hypothetical protein